MEKVNIPDTQKKQAGHPSCEEDEKLRMGDIIRRYRLAANLEQNELARAVGVTGNAVCGWENGRSRPTLDVLPALCNTLRLPVHTLLGVDVCMLSPLSAEDADVLSDYHALSASNQAIVSSLTNQLLAQQECSESKMLYSYHERIPNLTLLSSAAGPGAPAPDYVETEDVFVRTSHAAQNSDCMILVNGDSMEPAYPDGCRVFVNTREETPIGEVGIFIVNGEYLIKERREDRLFSLNRNHEDVAFYEDMDIRHFGRVLGIVDENDVLDGAELDRVRAAFETVEKAN